MARKIRSAKLKAWQRKFGQTARECFRATSGGSMSSYGSCMSSSLSKGGGRRRRRKSRR